MVEVNEEGLNSPHGFNGDVERNRNDVLETVGRLSDASRSRGQCGFAGAVIRDLRDKCECPCDGAVRVWVVVGLVVSVEPRRTTGVVALFQYGVNDSADDRHHGQNEKVDKSSAFAVSDLLGPQREFKDELVSGTYTCGFICLSTLLRLLGAPPELSTIFVS